MSDAYQYRTLDRSEDTLVDDLGETLPTETRPTEVFTPATPRWIPPKSEATAHEERAAVVRREAFEFGRIKWGSAFFGWVTAAGVTVLLGAALGAIGAGIGLALNGGSASAAARAARADATAVGLAGAIALGVTLFVAYYCGGYVAGRMARFAGVRQGFAVWLWAVAVAIVGTAGAYFGGILGNPITFAQGLPGVPSDQSTVMLVGIIAILGIAAVTALGALIGGRLGMRYHRMVDFAALDD